MKVFTVHEKINVNIEINVETLVKTAHHRNDRVERHKKISEVLGYGKPVGAFVVTSDTDKPTEIHTVMESGVIIIQNQENQKMITEIVARPPQILRYWRNLNLVCPTTLDVVIEHAEVNVELGYNYW